jgi:mono/diheme cytochrome c family protein
MRLPIRNTDVRRVTVATLAGVVLAAASLAAQTPPGSGQAGRGPSTGSGQAGRGGGETGVDRLRAFDPAAVERGRIVFGDKCGSCHRPNARGGQGFSGPDLIRSVLVLQDVNGREIGAHLQAAHKPPIALTPPDISDIATFLHREITFAAERTNYQLQYVMTGNARAGETYFKGAGGCSRCHSPTGDLKGIGSRHDGPRLQTLIAFGTMGGGRGRGPSTGSGQASEPSRAERRATVTLASGETFSGVLVRLTDFDVTIRDDAGKPLSWLRSGNTPKVQVTDPLQGHIDLLPKYTDADIHDLAAYLATLK